MTSSGKTQKQQKKYIEQAQQFKESTGVGLEWILEQQRHLQSGSEPEFLTMRDIPLERATAFAAGGDPRILTDTPRWESRKVLETELGGLEPGSFVGFGQESNARSVILHSGQRKPRKGFIDRIKGIFNRTQTVTLDDLDYWVQGQGHYFRATTEKENTLTHESSSVELGFTAKESVFATEELQNLQSYWYKEKGNPFIGFVGGDTLRIIEGDPITSNTKYLRTKDWDQVGKGEVIVKPRKILASIPFEALENAVDTPITSLNQLLSNKRWRDIEIEVPRKLKLHSEQRSIDEINMLANELADVDEIEFLPDLPPKPPPPIKLLYPMQKPIAPTDDFANIGKDFFPTPHGSRKLSHRLEKWMDRQSERLQEREAKAKRQEEWIKPRGHGLGDYHSGEIKDHSGDSAKMLGIGAGISLGVGGAGYMIWKATQDDAIAEQTPVTIPQQSRNAPLTSQAQDPMPAMKNGAELIPGGGYIYMVQHGWTGKQYFGLSTKSATGRIQKHLTGRGSGAVREELLPFGGNYTSQDFITKQWYYPEITYYELAQEEINRIAKYNTQSTGYNRSPGGEISHPEFRYQYTDPQTQPDINSGQPAQTHTRVPQQIQESDKEKLMILLGEENLPDEVISRITEAVLEEIQARNDTQYF